jgi:hypothetical protein
MKKRSANIILSTWLLCVLINCMACDKRPEFPDGGQTGQHTVGTPIGEVYTEIVGSDGGIVKSEDGLIEIEIPPGALANDTEIGIQPIKNTATSGIGHSYRLTPHGNSFLKKVTVRFYYSKYYRQLSSLEGIEIASQNDKGEWICTGNTQNDTVQKIISVQTFHFSDWSFIASMQLTPVVKTLGLNESVTLKALRYVFPQSGDDWLVPLLNPSAGDGEPMKIEQQYIVKWTLQGPGWLTINGSEALYTAPSSVADKNTTATITLELNVRGKKVLLISTIYLVVDGINISINGGEWKTYAGMATLPQGSAQFNIANLRFTTDLPQIVFLLPAINGKKANGIYPWSMQSNDQTDVSFEYDEPDLQHMYVSVYDDGTQTRDSGGFISIEEIEQNGRKYVTGFFAIDQSGQIKRASGEQVQVGGIMGTFKVQRDW